MVCRPAETAMHRTLLIDICIVKFVLGQLWRVYLLTGVSQCSRLRASRSAGASVVLRQKGLRFCRGSNGMTFSLSYAFGSPKISAVIVPAVGSRNAEIIFFEYCLSINACLLGQGADQPKFRALQRSRSDSGRGASHERCEIRCERSTCFSIKLADGNSQSV